MPNNPSQYDNQSYQYQNQMSANGQPQDSELNPIDGESEGVAIFVTTIDTDDSTTAIISEAGDIAGIDGGYQ
ncbi:MAG: hypothetical protein HC903_25690 [Methylacidiphilales bacterium]|nr:hypothetical protein [Candidatus Methylacidiphilales bacterium]NJR14745.1 hypothetical protein [Calothrix sp. CSU_2_0]